MKTTKTNNGKKEGEGEEGEEWE